MPVINHPSEGKNYDYVFFGMGCASLSLVMRMIRSGSFENKRFLIIEQSPKTKNDRTWCFWEKENGFFQDIVYKEWPAISVQTESFTRKMDIAPYRYKMIRGIDFYQYCLKEISQQPGIDILYASVNRWHYDKESVVYYYDGKPVNLGPAMVFNSIYQPAENKKTLRLLQHFKGWLIETTDNSFFDPAVATIMDFRVGQERGTTFGYVLPFTPSTALVEYTFFTKELLSAGEYDQRLEDYLRNYLGIADYRIIEKEFGVIPMTNEKLKLDGHGWQIGTAGGQTKASSGYTFQFIQKQSEQITKRLLKNRKLDNLDTGSARFRFYDNVLLDILYNQTYPGKEIFTRLFSRNKPQKVLKFLDNETNLGEELSIISSLPVRPFFNAALKTLRR